MKLHVDSRGEGPRIALLHGGAPPGNTWPWLLPLSERWRLDSVFRRGYPPSPPTERQDFDNDARDLIELLEEEPAHLVGHSYGGTGAAVAACAQPGLVLSLTLVEPALMGVARGDPAVEEFEQVAQAFLRDGLDAPEDVVRRFLTAAGARWPIPDPPPPSLQVVLAASRGGRPPSEADPRLETLPQAGVPVMVVSGEHQPAIEVVCDTVAARSGARREILAGEGHFPQRLPQFAALLEEFMRGMP